MLPQWLQLLATSVALALAVYLYGQSLKDKRTAQPRLVYAIPEAMNGVRAGQTVDHLADGRHISSTVVSIEYPRPGAVTFNDHARLYFVTVKNDSQEVMNKVDVMAWAELREHDRATSETCPYVAPGTEEKFIMVGPAPTDDATPGGPMVTCVVFGDSSGYRWRRYLNEPLSTDRPPWFKRFRRPKPHSDGADTWHPVQ
ncbi:hypothetical protein [Aeromicrobium sp.]|uniref:hypothetical protein n=1 Tax=Aeromicrobium sp. TaxID=1871063 RepID=UPI003D6A37BD